MSTSSIPRTRTSRPLADGGLPRRLAEEVRCDTKTRPCRSMTAASSSSVADPSTETPVLALGLWKRFPSAGESPILHSLSRWTWNVSSMEPDPPGAS